MLRAVVVAAVAALVLPTAAGAAVPVPVPGSERIAVTAPDPAGGAPWAVRTWRTQAARAADARTCMQVGQRRGADLVRRLGPADRVLTRADRTVCAWTGKGAGFVDTPTVFERLADDPARPARFVRTIAGGVARDDVRGVDVRVGDRTHRARFRAGAWLAVLPGTVRRSQVVLAYRLRGGRTVTANFRTGRRHGDREFSPHVAGSTRKPLTVPSPSGGPPLALTRFATRDGEDCVEPGRLVAGEAGQWSPEWGAFADFPTLVPLPGYAAGDWQPASPTPQSTNGCEDGYDEAGVRAVVARRVEPGLLALAGILRPGTRRLAIRRPDGRYAQLAVRDGAFLAGLPSTGAVGERAVLEITDRRGRRTSAPLPTGDQDLPEDQVEGLEPREGGTVARVRWIGGFEPFGGADALRVGGQVRVTVYARHAPYFSPEGYGYLSPAIGLFKCIDVVLPEPLGTARLTDRRGRAPSGEDRASAPGTPDTQPCNRVPAGFRAELPLTLTAEGDEEQPNGRDARDLGLPPR